MNTKSNITKILEGLNAPKVLENTVFWDSIISIANTPLPYSLIEKYLSDYLKRSAKASDVTVIRSTKMYYRYNKFTETTFLVSGTVASLDFLPKDPTTKLTNGLDKKLREDGKTDYGILSKSVGYVKTLDNKPTQSLGFLILPDGKYRWGLEVILVHPTSLVTKVGKVNF